MLSVARAAMLFEILLALDSCLSKIKHYFFYLMEKFYWICLKPAFWVLSIDHRYPQPVVETTTNSQWGARELTSKKKAVKHMCCVYESQWHRAVKFYILLTS